MRGAAVKPVTSFFFSFYLYLLSYSFVKSEIKPTCKVIEHKLYIVFKTNILMFSFSANNMIRCGIHFLVAIPAAKYLFHHKIK